MVKIIRVGTPSRLDEYYIVDDDWIILQLHQRGCLPAWKDEECLYFKKNKKLKKALSKIGIEIDIED